MARNPEIGRPLEVPANRKWFLEQVAAGVEPERAATALGIDVRTAQRYAKANAPFMGVYKDAKREGRKARKLVKGEVPLMRDAPSPAPPAPAPVPRASRRPKEPDPAPVVADGYLEQFEKTKPSGLKLNSHLPPLSVKTFLGKLQAIMWDDKAPVALRIAAVRQIGLHTLMPTLRPPPPRSGTGTGTDAESTPRAVLGGSRVQVVTMIAPDNGLYAPGRAPGQTQVVDEDEAVEAEVVAARPS